MSDTNFDDLDKLLDEDPLAILLRLEDEQQAKMRAQAREKLETKRSVQRTLDEEERRRSLDQTRLGSYSGAAAIQREMDRKAAERRDAEKRRREDRLALQEFYGIPSDD